MYIRTFEKKQTKNEHWKENIEEKGIRKYFITWDVQSYSIMQQPRNDL